MAGCEKADRNRKSAANAAYKGGNRQQVNKEKRAKREARKAAKLAAKRIERAAKQKPMRGDARRKRRAALRRAA